MTECPIPEVITGMTGFLGRGIAFATNRIQTNRACYRLSHNALFWNSQSYSGSEYIYDFNRITLITNLDSVHRINEAIFAILINDINKYLLMMRTQLLITCDTIRYTHHIFPLTTRTFVLRIHKLSIAAIIMKKITMISLTSFSATRSLRMAAFNIQAVTK